MPDEATTKSMPRPLVAFLVRSNQLPLIYGSDISSFTKRKKFEVRIRHRLLDPYKTDQPLVRSNDYAANMATGFN